MKTVVTGGTGFIGSHLVKALLEMGRKVIVASDFARLEMENLSNLGIDSRDVEIRRVDLTDYKQALEAVEDAGTLFHLAARVGSLQYLHGTEIAELAALQSNLLIDTNVFKACLQKGVRKIVYASSCAVYPMHKQLSPGVVFSESDLNLDLLTQQTQQTQSTQQTINPDGGYGWAKLLGELQLSWMNGIKATPDYRLSTVDSRLPTINVGIARIFNIYGENEPLGDTAHVVADLSRKAILYPKVEFSVHGDGSQSRDFLYVSDCVDALLKLEAALSNSTNSMNSITINIGSGKATSVKEIVEKIIQISGKDINQNYKPGKSAGPLSRTADITKAKKLLGWQPKTSLDEGLRRTSAWAEKGVQREGVS